MRKAARWLKLPAWAASRFLSYCRTESSWNSAVKPWTGDQLTDLTRCPLLLASRKAVTNQATEMSERRMSEMTSNHSVVPGIYLVDYSRTTEGTSFKGVSLLPGVRRPNAGLALVLDGIQNLSSFV